MEIGIRVNGNGIPEQIQGRIFDPFFTTKKAGKGTGQGLAIAKRIVEDNHGGSMSFSSRPGKGTLFLISIPFGAKKSEEKV